MVGKEEGGSNSVRKVGQGHAMEGLTDQGEELGLCSKCDERHRGFSHCNGKWALSGERGGTAIVW